MHQHFLQSPAWETFEQSLGAPTFRHSTPNFSYLAIQKSTPLGPYLFIPYGPSLKTSAKDSSTAQRSLQMALKSLTKLAKHNHCFFIRLEPTTPLNAQIIAKSSLVKTKDLDPADTWQLDLTPDKPTLLKHFTQGTRTCVNQFPKKGLSVEISHNPTDIHHLTTLQHQLAKQKGITAYAESYLQAELAQPFASLYLVRYNPSTDQSLTHPDPSAPMSQKPRPPKNAIIAASLFFDDPASSPRFYMQAASDQPYRPLPATHGMLATAIFDAKAKGLQTFDFWGIAPTGAPTNHPWAGFTKFKQSFSGTPVHYAGTYDLILNHPKYTLYKLLRPLSHLLRKK